MDSLIIKLQNLPQYEGKSPKEIEVIAKKIRQQDLNIAGSFIDIKEKRFAKNLMRRYLDDYDIIGESEKQTVKTIVYMEVLKYRFENFMNDYNNDKKNQNALPMRLIEDYNKVVDQIEKLKRSLGLTKSQQQDSKSDAYKALDELRNRFYEYIPEHRDEFESQCPGCKKWVLWRRRIKDFDAIIHPMFRGSTLYNEFLFKLYEKGKLTFKEISEILETTSQFIERIYKKIFLVEQKKKSAD